MRCPYCGNFNQDTAAFCISCGRNLKTAPLHTPANKQPVPQMSRATRAAPRPLQRPAYSKPVSSHAVYPVKEQALPPSSATRQQPSPVPATLTAPGEPEPPAPFPPRTVEQLHMLEQAARNYTLVSDEENVGRKRTVRVAYAPCAGWQQLATLYKALNEFQQKQGSKFDTVIVQGLTDTKPDLYNFNNGQLIFDRSVRLGSDVLNRYQFETGNGFAGDAMRIVLTEAVK